MISLAVDAVRDFKNGFRSDNPYDLNYLQSDDGFKQLKTVFNNIKERNEYTFKTQDVSQKQNTCWLYCVAYWVSKNR